MNEQKNYLLGYDFMQMNNVGFKTIESKTGVQKRCMVIPIDDNGIHITKDMTTGKTKGAYYNIDMFSRREVGRFEETHNLKPHVSKEFAEKNTELAAKMKNTYLGNAKPLIIQSNNVTETMPMDNVEPSADDDLPF